MNARKKYEEMVEDGKATPLHELQTGQTLLRNEDVELKFRSFRDIYEEFVDEHGDPNNTTLFVDYLESKFNQ